MNEPVPPAAPTPQSPLPRTVTIYQVRISGLLDDSWTEWFDDMIVTFDTLANETLLTGSFADQSALHGLLAKIRDLGLNLVELRRIARQAKT